MLALSQSRFLRLLAFGALYLAQGIPAGFITVGYVVFLTDQGLSNEAIGSAVGISALPWAFKLVWGPIIDRFPSARFGRRRPFIVSAQLAMGASLLLLLLLDPKRDLSLVVAVLFVYNTFASLQDVAADAMAVDLLQPKETGIANGVMLTAKTVGGAIGGGAGMVVVKHLGWPTLFIGLVAIQWAIMLLIIVLRERPRAELSAARDRPKLSLGELRRSFAFVTPLVGLAIAMLTPAGFMLCAAVYTRLLRAELKLSVEAIGLLEGVLTPAGSIVGALAGGLLAYRLGVRKVIGAMMACIGATMAAFALAPGLWPSFAFLVVVSTAGQLFFGAYSAALLGFCMRLSNPAVGGTQFSIFMAAFNLTAAWAAPLGGWIADAFSVRATFAVAAVAQIVFVGLLPFCDPRAAEARFRPAPAGQAPLPEAEGSPEPEDGSVMASR